MKNAVKLIGIFAIMALFGLNFWACEEPEDPDTLSGKVSIHGVAQVGETLTANTSKLGGSGTIRYTWNRKGITISSGYNETYTVRKADVGSTITVTVERYEYFDYPGYIITNRPTLTSAPTAIVTDYSSGLAFTLINNNTAYSVSKGTATASIIIIPAVYEGLPVIEIADSGFSSYANMTSIIMPSGLTKIGNYAFFQCGNLESVVILAGVASIGNFAFHDCGSLTTVYYGGEDNTAWSKILIGSSNITLLNVDIYYYSETHSGTANTHWRFGGYLPEIWATYGLAFTLNLYNTEYLVSKGTATDDEVFIPAAYEGIPVTAIQVSGFANYTSMTSITIPNSVTSINHTAFAGCTGLTSVIIGNRVTSIGIGAFAGCTGLTSITIPNSVISIGVQAFMDCTGLTSIMIPNSVTSIGIAAFYRCTGLTSVIIGNSVTSIDSYAFYRCTGLTSITIPDSVTSIGDSAFSGCTGLTSITIPDSVTSIGRGAFSDTGIWNNAPYNNVVYLDKWIVGYKGIITDNLVINTGTIGICDSAFSHCTSLTSITIPNSVTSIGQSAFYECTSLTSVTISNSVTSIGGSAFSGCTGLTSITIPNSVTSIGQYAFYNCYSLTSITIPNSVTSIGLFAFSYCTGLTSITIGANKDLFNSYLVSSFIDTYNNNGKIAGTYTRPNTSSEVWTKQ